MSKIALDYVQFLVFTPLLAKRGKMRDKGGKTGGKGFSRRFDAALAETRMIDALVKADGWNLAEFLAAPPWLKELYARHAEAARREMQKPP